MITNFSIESFNLVEYEWSLFQIDTYADPSYPDEGSMIIRLEGLLGNRLNLINGVIPHANQPNQNIMIRTDDMTENGTTTAKLKMESIPTNHKFVLVWESKTPYFIGAESGEKYRF